MKFANCNFQPRRVLLTLSMAALAAACSRSETTVVKNVSLPGPTPSVSVSPRVSGSAEIYHGTGTVLTINPKFPSVEMDHEEIVGLMPAMKMEFYVKDVSLINGLNRGDKIDFTIENGVGGLKITELKKR